MPKKSRKAKFSRKKPFWKQPRYQAIIAIVLIAGTCSYYYYTNLVIKNNGPIPQSGEYHLFQTSQESVDAYGFYYPVTFVFDFPSGSSDLGAWYRYDDFSKWTQLPTKTLGSFFNGENAARFDYDENNAYISVGFCGHTTLQIKIVDSQSEVVPLSYSGVAKFYDNRHAAVTSHIDDYGIGGGHIPLINEFQRRKLWYGCAVVTNQPDWADLQAEVNEGYVEVQSHSRNHPQPPFNYDSEIGGSSQDIRNHIQNIPYGQYVFVYVSPYGKFNEDIYRTCGNYHYLVATSSKDDGGDAHLNGAWGEWRTAWKIFPTRKTTSMGTQLAPDPGGTDPEFLNGEFDRCYNAGGIYELGCHPVWVDAQANYVQQHLDYIAGRNDVWYAPLGHTYAYRYVALFVQHSVIHP